MSTIHLIIIEGGKVYHLEEHWRRVMDLLNNELHDISGSSIIGRIDEGYMLIDFDSQLIVNRQYAFSFKDLQRAEWIQGWQLSE